MNSFDPKMELYSYFKRDFAEETSNQVSYRLCYTKKILIEVLGKYSDENNNWM